jgi:hypothetical protein
VLPSASGTRIRIAQQEDSVAIAAVHAASWRGSYRGILSDKYLNDELESESPIRPAPRLVLGKLTGPTDPALPSDSLFLLGPRPFET